jgi:hypothetical protein
MSNAALGMLGMVPVTGGASSAAHNLDKASALAARGQQATDDSERNLLKDTLAGILPYVANATWP